MTDQPVYVVCYFASNFAGAAQSLAAPDTVVISATTYQLVQGLFTCQVLGTPAPKGLDHRLAVYQGLGASTAQSRAAAALDMPPSTTARTISSRPFGVRRAFLWVSIRSSANRFLFGDISVPGPDRMDNLLKVHT